MSPVYDLETGERVDYVNTYDRITFDQKSTEELIKDIQSSIRFLLKILWVIIYVFVEKHI